MTRREELRQAHEDALFALMMDYVAEEEGKKELEETMRFWMIRRQRFPRKCAGRA